MRWLRRMNGVALVVLLAMCWGLGGCTGSNTPGRMAWVTPFTMAPHVGTVYCIRGWTGVFSAGIDEMAKQLNDRGVNAVVFMPEQYPELAAAMVERYKNAPQHEPVCFIGHSRGVDSSLIISRELEKAKVTVDLIACLDSVDETTVSANVRVCYNYWMPGIFGNSNLLRGIPLMQEPGSTGRLYNYNLKEKQYSGWRGAMTDHISMDDDPLIQKRIMDQVMEVCVERSHWTAPGGSGAAAGVSPPADPTTQPATRR